MVGKTWLRTSEIDVQCKKFSTENVSTIQFYIINIV